MKALGNKPPEIKDWEFCEVCENPDRCACTETHYRQALIEAADEIKRMHEVILREWHEDKCEDSGCPFIDLEKKLRTSAGVK